MSFTETLQSLTGKLLADCTDQELYLALLELVRQKSADRVQPVTGRKLYYISAEFLIGKLLSNNLINLGLYEEARDALAAAGKRLSDIEEVEPEPSLGNGGLGRLAACFLDSLATLNLPGDGVGLRYHFGLFHQSFEDGVQNEKPDPWLTAHSWAEKTDVTYPVELAGKEYTARLYKLAVTGYEGRTNTLNLFDLDTIDESIVHDGIAFDKTAIDKNLTLFLYPDDSDEAGRRLRVYQQYLMVSAGAQLILAECAARGCNYHDLADYAAIQINDTHPSMIIPEMIRLLGQRGIEFEEAVDVYKRQLLLRGIHLGGRHPLPLCQPQAPWGPEGDPGSGKCLQPELHPDREPTGQGGLLRLFCRLRPAGAHRHRPARRAEKEPVLHRRPHGSGRACLLRLRAEQ